MDPALSIKMPTWIEMPPPPQFANIIYKSWYYHVENYYFALVFTSRGSERAMAVYHLVKEQKAREEKYPTVLAAMEEVQRVLSENKCHVKVWGDADPVSKN